MYSFCLIILFISLIFLHILLLLPFLLLSVVSLLFISFYSPYSYLLVVHFRLHFFGFLSFYHLCFITFSSHLLKELYFLAFFFSLFQTITFCYFIKLFFILPIILPLLPGFLRISLLSNSPTCFSCHSPSHYFPCFLSSSSSAPRFSPLNVQSPTGLSWLKGATTSEQVPLQGTKQQMNESTVLSASYVH